MENPLRVGDRVKINPIYRTESVQKIVNGMVGTIEKIYHYPSEAYKVVYEKPYRSHGYTVIYEYYYAKELIRI